VVEGDHAPRAGGIGDPGRPGEPGDASLHILQDECLVQLAIASEIVTPVPRPCKTVPGVLKELTVFAIIYNLVRMVIRQSATLQHSAVERTSFLDALRWPSAPHTGMPLVALIVNLARPLRVEPRVKKQRPKSFPLMIKPRQALHQ
jgi:hypothetical protein